MLVDDLSQSFWDVRCALETLAYELQVDQLMAAAGRVRWLSRSTAATQAAMVQLETANTRRIAIMHDLALDLGLNAGLTIEQLADALPEHSEMLRAHSEHLHHLASEITTLLDQVKNLLARNLAATTDALALLGVSPTYGPGSTSNEQTTVRQGRSVLVDVSA